MLIRQQMQVIGLKSEMIADYPIDLTHFKMQDRDWYNAYPIPAGTILQPGERIVVVEDDDRVQRSSS